MKCQNCGSKSAKPYCSDCELLTITRALELLQVSRATYYRLVREGRIHPRHPTERRALVPREDVDRILSAVTT